MLCRKKLVLFLTLTTLGLMYISANHYLSADSGKTSSPPSNEDSISSEIVKPVMNKKTQLEKYLQPLKEDNVEFRTINPVPTGNKKLGMNFIFLCTDISSRLEPFIQMHCFEDHRCNCKTCHYYVVDCKENILFSFYRVSKHVCNKLNVMFWSSEMFASKASYVYKKCVFAPQSCILHIFRNCKMKIVFSSYVVIHFVNWRKVALKKSISFYEWNATFWSENTYFCKHCSLRLQTYLSLCLLHLVYFKLVWTPGTSVSHEKKIG